MPAVPSASSSFRVANRGVLSAANPRTHPAKTVRRLPAATRQSVVAWKFQFLGKSEPQRSHENHSSLTTLRSLHFVHKRKTTDFVNPCGWSIPI
jgi:hypothetical protein